MINNYSKDWVKSNPKDEWILCKTKYTQRDNVGQKSNKSKYIITDFKDKDSIKKFEDENISVFKRIINTVWEENTTSFSILSRSVILLMYIKSMYVRGHSNELFLGLLVGLIMQLGDLLVHLFKYMKSWYFGNREGFDVHKALIRRNKFNFSTISIIPAIVIFLINILKANSYSRVIGEWIVNMSTLYMYISQIAGFYITQNVLRIFDYSRYSASILFILVIYIGTLLVV